MNDKIYLMITNVKLIDDMFFVPLNSFARLYNQFKAPSNILNIT